MITLLAPPAWGASVAGTVSTWPEGEPLGDVVVHVTDLTGRSRSSPADAEGRWSVPVPAGRFRIKAVPVAGTNRLPAWWDDRPFFCGAEFVNLGAASEVSTVDLALPAGGRILGRMPDALPGTRVWADGLGAWGQIVRHGDEVDEEGAFVLDGLDAPMDDGVPQASPYKVEVREPSRPPWWSGGVWDVADADPTEVRRGGDAEIALQRPPVRGVAGQVVGVDGEAIADATVQLGFQGWTVEQEIDPQGRFSFPGVPTAPLSVRARGHDRPWSPAQVVPAGTDDVVGLSVSAPLGGWLRVEVDWDGPLDGAVVAIGDERWGWTGGQGGSMLAGPLQAGPTQVSLLRGTRNDLRSAGSAVEAVVTVGGEESAQLVGEPGRTVHGLVTGRGLGPLPSARIRFETASGALIAEASTGEDGVAVVDGLPEGPLRVSAHWPAFCSQDPTWVKSWFPGGPDPADAESTSEPWIEFVLPPDTDADGMDDDWELRMGLNPARRDGAEDPDGDGFSNIEEYLLGSVPMPSPSSCRGGVDSLGLTLALPGLFVTIRRPRTVAKWLDGRRLRPRVPAAESCHEEKGQS